MFDHRNEDERNQSQEPASEETPSVKFLTTLGIYSIITAAMVAAFGILLERVAPPEHDASQLTTADIEGWAMGVSETAVMLNGLSPVDSACIANALTVRCTVDVEGSNRKIVTECDFSKWLCNLVGFESSTGDTTVDYDNIRSE